MSISYKYQVSCFPASRIWSSQFHNVIIIPKRALANIDPRPTSSDVCTPAWVTEAELEELVEFEEPVSEDALATAVAMVYTLPNTEVVAPAPGEAKV